MPKLTIALGVVLIIVGVAGYFASGQESWTALIPSILGVLMLIPGVIAASKPGARKHAMHAAVAVAVLGLLGTFRSLGSLPTLLSDADSLERPTATGVQAGVAILLIVYIVMAVMSFVKARRG